MARRGDPELLEQLDQRAVARRARPRHRRQARRHPGRGERPVEAGRCAAQGRRRRPGRAVADCAAGRSASTSGCWPPSTTRCRPRCATCCCASPTCRTPTRPTAPSDADNPVVKGPIGLPDRVPRAPAGAALGDGDRARHPRQRARHQDQRRDVHHAARPRRHAGPGAVPVRARQQRRRVRGDPPAVARHHRHAHRHRPAAEVRRRRLRDRARRPVVHPHRRGAAHVDLRRRGARRRRSCRSG